MDKEVEFRKRIELIHGLGNENNLDPLKHEPIVDIRHEEFRAMVDVFLEKDTEEEMIDQLEKLQVELHRLQAELYQRYASGEIDANSYVDTFNKLLHENFLECEKLIGKERFVKLFGGPPESQAGYIDKDAFLKAEEGLDRDYFEQGRINAFQQMQLEQMQQSSVAYPSFQAELRSKQKRYYSPPDDPDAKAIYDEGWQYEISTQKK